MDLDWAHNEESWQQSPETAQREDDSLHKPPGDCGSFLVANRPHHDELRETAHRSANIRQSIHGYVRPSEIKLDSVHGAPTLMS